MSKADRDINDVLNQRFGDTNPRVGGWRPKSEQSVGCALVLLVLVLAVAVAILV